MVRKVWAGATLLIVAVASGCTERRAADSADAALAEVSTHLAATPPNLDAAYDFLLAAMRISPESPEVYAATVDFIQRSASGDDNALDLANDLYARANELIPFQPVDQISAARQQHQELDRLFNSPVDPARDPFGPTLQAIKDLQSAHLPDEIEEALFQQLENDLDTAAIDALRSKATSSDKLWQGWRAAHATLKAARISELSAQYDEVAKRQQGFLARSKQSIADCDAAPPGQLRNVGQRIVDLINEGLPLSAEVRIFADFGVVAAENHGNELEKQLDVLARTREWMQNQFALNTIAYLKRGEDGEATPSENLKRLAKCDERRLTPYVFARYQEEWDRWFAELETDDERIEATKARVLNGVR